MKYLMGFLFGLILTMAFAHNVQYKNTSLKNKPIMIAQSSTYQSESDLTRQAIKATQDLLTNQKKLQQMLKQGDDSAQATNAFTKSVGGEKKSDIYKLSAEILPTMMKKFNNDPEALKSYLQETSIQIKDEKNPTAFYHNLTPDQIQKIKELSNKIQRSKKTP